MSNINGKFLFYPLCIFFLVVITVSCSPSPANPTPTDQSPAAPEGLELEDGTDDEGDDYQGDDTGDVEQLPSLTTDKDGIHWLSIMLPGSRSDGVYLGVFEEEGDDEGSRSRGGITNCEIQEDAVVACPVPAGAEQSALNFQVIFLPAKAPIFPGSNDGLHLPDPVLKQLDSFTPPLDLSGETPLSKLDRNLALLRMCIEQEVIGNLFADLPDFCDKLLGVYEPDFPSGGVEDHLNGLLDILRGDSQDEESEIVNCQDHEWKDTIFCTGAAEFGSAAAATSGLAQACQNKLGITFEDPLTAFEDPLTAFEDPLTAHVLQEKKDYISMTDLVETVQGGAQDVSGFEDPLTAFEDPLTAFEDPLTAFEDPLTAQDIGRLTMLYAGIRPFLNDWNSYFSCNLLVNVADNHQTSLTGNTLLSQLMKEIPGPIEVTKPQTISVPPLEDVRTHCSIFNTADVLGPSYYVTQGDNHVTLHFPFPELVPGYSLYVPGNPLPYIYYATLGGVPSETCYLSAPEQLSCLITRLGRNSQPLIDVPVELFTMGCSDAIYSGFVSLPGIDYSRCDFFESINMRLYIDNPSTNLKLYVTMENGVPGLGVDNYPGFDQMPVIYWSTFDEIESRSYILSDYSSRLYTDFTIPTSALNSYKLYELFVNYCDAPILSKTIIVSTGGADDSGGSGGGGEVVCDPDASTKEACEAGGGTWKTYINKAPECICP